MHEAIEGEACIDFGDAIRFFALVGLFHQEVWAP
jgi:hypothetical protein